MVQLKSTASYNQRHHLLKIGVSVLLIGSSMQWSYAPLFQSTANAVTQTHQSLKTFNADAVQKVKSLKFLNTEYKQSFIELLSQLDYSQADMKTVLKAANEANRLASAATTKDNPQPQVAQIDEKLARLKAKVDEGQQKGVDGRGVLDEPSLTGSQNSKASPILGQQQTEDLKQMSSENENTLDVFDSTGSDPLQTNAISEILKTVHERLSSETRAQSSNLLETWAETVAQGSTSPVEPLREASDTVNQIDQWVSKQISQDDANHYLATKHHLLNTFDRQIKGLKDTPKDEKQQLLRDSQTVTRQLNQQNDTILSQLKENGDKQAVVKNILGTVFNQKEAEQRAQKITIEGKTNQQLADQIQREIDQLKSTTSDDLLRGMFDNTSNRQGLLERILASRFDRQKAQQLAQQIMQGNPNNEVLLQRLKTQFKSDGTATSDDILNTILNNTDANPKVIESILGGRLNSENAALIAKRISQNESENHDILKQLDDELRAQANRLLTLREQLSQLQQNAKIDIQHLFSPINQLSDIIGNGLFGRDMNKSGPTNDKLRELLNQQKHGTRQQSGGLFKHDFAPKPNIDPYQAIKSQSGSDHFLDGLFDQNGQFVLPSAGEILKHDRLPIISGVILLGIGLILIYMKRRKMHLTAKK
ncbi:hypothetical protein [Staphylococcus lutrae]|uniref:Cell wall anchor protein n=1 Tax=Staphylococcus lutrae TaxID=155085 RepID=A0AAC9WJA6_9STAP|nr:hypothetical protein [Staphylococcus lutrae]ARJ50656.1 hypothetical protein B5P37_04650 [Staphylococcus lutrae]PNZ39124.1 cell wall anchor protein [Staphylococcus lutrae]